MKKLVLASLMMTCLSFQAMAQDDLYFVPKKKVETKTATGTAAKVVIEKDKAPTTVYAAPNSTVVVKDVQGNVRDVDEYNRRYTSRDNTFSMENDTLYIEEKPYNERGEWVNGFEGTQDDYEYAMRIIRFRNPRYAIPVSSPLYWDVVYSLPSWEWNVFDDGLYAYAFPTYSNRLWWDWRWNYPWGSSWAWSGWYSPWYGNYWYGGWHGGWGGYWGGYWGHPHHPHHGPLYAGVGGYWGGGHGRFGSTARNPGIHAGRYQSTINRNNVARTANRRQVATTNGARSGRDNVGTGVRQVRRSSSANVNRGDANRSTNTVRRSTAGRVVRSTGDNANSVRPRTTAVRNRNGEATSVRDAAGVRRSNNTYVRSTESRGSSYDRPSSTRSSVTDRSSSSYQKRSEGSSYRSNSTRSASRDNSSYRSNSSSSSRSSGGSFSSGGGSSRSSSSAGGGGSRSGGGGGGSRGGRR